MYQHQSLEQTGHMIEHSSNKLKPEDMLDRAEKLANHLQREDHMDNEFHRTNLHKFETDFHAKMLARPRMCT